MESDRLNLPSTSAVKIDLLGHQLQFSQDPNSKHLGTTVWDASMVFVKYLEKNSRRGRFCPSKLKGKRAIELGAGCGVAGFGMAMLGCDLVTTDQKEVLPLLQRNVERNISTIMQTDPNSVSFGTIKVAELDWGDKDHIQAVQPPFDYVIGTDVVYAEHLLDPLLQTICALSGPRTTIVLGYEIRSTSVHEKMLQMWKSNFDVKTVPKTRMDYKYQHPSIQLYIMGQKLSGGIAPSTNQVNDKVLTTVESGSEERDGENVEKDECSGKKDIENCSTATELPGQVNDKVLETVESGSKESDEENVEKDECSGKKDIENCSTVTELPGPDLSDWEVRRYGAMAARLLHNVKIK